MKALIVVLICALLAFNPAEAATATNSGWRLTQKNLLYGDVTVYIWKTGVIVASNSKDYCFSCCAPAWDAVMYSENRKVYYSRPYSHWVKNGFRTAISIQDNSEYYNWPIRFVEEKKQFGVTTSLYAFPYRFESGQAASLKNGNVGTYLVTSEVKTAKQAEQFLQALFDLPPISGVPLHFHKIGRTNSFGFGLNYNKKEERHSLLDTKEIKKLNSLRSVAQYKGYKLVSDGQIIVRKGELDNVMQQFWDEK